MKKGQKVFIVLPDTNPRDIYKGVYEFNKKFEIVEVIIEEVRKRKEYTHYRLRLVDETQFERLLGSPVVEKDGDPGAGTFGWEDSIASTKEELKKALFDEVKLFADGWALLLKNLTECFKEDEILEEDKLLDKLDDCLNPKPDPSEEPFKL